MCTCDEYFDEHQLHLPDCPLYDPEAPVSILDPNYFSLDLNEEALKTLESRARAAQETLLTACDDPFEPWQVEVPEFAPTRNTTGTLWRIVDNQGEGVTRISSDDGMDAQEAAPLADYLAAVHPTVIRELIKEVRAHRARAAEQTLPQPNATPPTESNTP